MTLNTMDTRRTGWRIVVAEDESIIAHDLKCRLTGMGFVVLAIAKTGEEAIQETLARRPDIVLFDIRLKGNVDGIQAAAEIRSQADIPVVFATASSDPVTFERSRIADPYGFIFKPYDDREIKATLDLAITKNMSERLVRQSESRYRLLFENNLAGVFRLDGKGRILDCNKALLAMMGLPPDKALNPMSASRFLVDRAEGGRIADELRAHGRIEGRELSLMRGDGARVWVVMTIVAAEESILVGTVIDVTERKKIETELSEQRQFMKLLIDNIPDQIYIKDLEHRFLFCNPGCARLLGKPADAILGRTDADFFPPDLAAQYVEDERRVLEGGEALVNVEEPQIDAAGTQGWSLSTKIPTRGQDGKINGLMGINRDITAYKRYEEILQDDVRFQQNLLDAIPAPVFYRDKVGRFLGCNAAFEEFYGVTRTSITGKTLAMILPDDQVEAQRNSDNMLIANPGSILYETVTKNATGEKRTGVVHKATFEDADGTVEGVIGVFVDLSDQHKLREELVRSEHRYRSMFEENNAVMLLLDPETGMIVDANPAAVRFYGYPREVLTRMNVTEINPEPLKKLKEGLARAISGAQREFVWKHRIANGEMRDVEVHSGPVAVDGRNIVLSIIHDVTAKKRAEEAHRLSDERFRIISENVPELIAVLGPDGRFQYASPAYRHLDIDEALLRERALQTWYILKMSGACRKPSMKLPGRCVIRVLNIRCTFPMGAGARSTPPSLSSSTTWERGLSRSAETLPNGGGANILCGNCQARWNIIRHRLSLPTRRGQSSMSIRNSAKSRGTPPQKPLATTPGFSNPGTSPLRSMRTSGKQSVRAANGVGDSATSERMARSFGNRLLFRPLPTTMA